ncbi:hypothetical protein D9M69_567330 [compost metagenome]
MRFGGIGQREALLRLAHDAAGQHVAEEFVGHRQHVRAWVDVVNHRGPREPDRALGGQHLRIDDHGARRRAIAHERAARLQAIERGLQRVLAHRVVDHGHALALGDLAHTLGDVLARSHDGVRAAVGLGDGGLLVGADGADHRDAHGARPLAGDQAHATGGCVVQDGLATLQWIDLPEQVLRRHALHHQRGGGAFGNAVR